MSSEAAQQQPLTAMSSPPCRVLVRSKNAFELYTLGTNSPQSGDPTSSNVSPRKVKLLDHTKPCTSTVPVCTAPDGSFTLIHTQNVGIVKCNLQTEAVQENFFSSSTLLVQMMHLSPLGNYLLTWEKYNTTTTNKNLKLWCVHTGQLIVSFVQKSLSRESWPYLQFTHDELYFFVAANNTQIRVYNNKQDILPMLANASHASSDNTNTDAEPRYCSKLQVPCTTLSVQYHSAMTSMMLQPTPSPIVAKSSVYYFTTFVGKTKDKPAMASIYSYTPSSSSSGTTDDTAVEAFSRLATKSLFQAEECNTKWSPSLQIPSCLLTLSVAIDATGQSYYGNSQLYLWNHSNTNKSSVDSALIAVPLPQDGPVLSCQWIPDPNKPLSFIVIAGKIPPMTSHHHGMTGDVTFLYGNNVSRNTIIPSPHGRFICTAGFGNMPGGMSFWDVNKKKLLPHSYDNVHNTLKSDTPVTMYSWSPDSRFFLTATTAPRMNVENGIHLYKYTGELVTSTNPDDTTSTIIPWNNKEYQPNHLYEAIFVPSLLHVYPDRPQSPVPEGRTITDTPQPTSSTAAPAKSTAYVPPSARRAMGGGGTSLAERLRREKEGTAQGATKVVNATVVANKGSTGANRAIPGLTQTATAKTKSQIKREKLKQKLEQQPATAEVVPETGAKKPEPMNDATVEAAAAVTAIDVNNSVDVEKRVRKLKKILKQIEDLKLLTVELNDDQKAKVASEPKILSELKELGA